MPKCLYNFSSKFIIPVALIILNFSVLYCDTNENDYKKSAEQIYQKIQQADSLLKIRKLAPGSNMADSVVAESRRMLPPNDTILAYALNVDGKAAYFRSDYNKCLELWQEAYNIRYEVLGLDHVKTAASLNNLGALAKTVGEFQKADSLYTEVLGIRQRIQPENHPDFAGLYTNLGSLKRITGKFTEAESLYHQAYDINQKTMGLNHPVTAGCLNNIAVLYEEQGRYKLAEEFYRKALNSRMETLGARHPQTASSLNNLGNLFYNMKNYNVAESLYTLALEIRTEVYGEDHLALASSYNNIAIINMETGNNNKAIAFCEKALEIKSNKLPPDHPLLASSYDNLGIVYYNIGEYNKSEEYYSKSQAIYNKTYGDYHPYTTSSKANIAQLHAAIGNYSQALKDYSQIFDARQKFIRDVFTYASEANKLKYLKKYPLIDNKLLSLALKVNSPEAARLAFTMILESKALVIDAICAEKQLVFGEFKQDLQEQFNTWRKACTGLSTVALAGVDYLKTDIYKQKTDSLFAVKDSMELLLSRNYAEFRNDININDVSLEQLASKLGADEILWEIVKYNSYDFEKIGSENDRTGSSKYLAFVFNNRNELNLVELGDAGLIDSAITGIRQNLYTAGQFICSFGEQAAENLFNERTNELYNMVIEPLIAGSSNAATIIIAPDGEFNLIPFEILADSDNRYLIEKYNIEYVSSGRDILDFKNVHEDFENVLIFADPEYDCSFADDKSKQINSTDNNAEYNHSGAGTNNGCGFNNFSRLPFTRVEAEEIAELHKKFNSSGVHTYYNDKASESALKSFVSSPQILHLATHGFFCTRSDSKYNEVLQNPLLRSGLALANANCLNQMSFNDVQNLDEDGILTAFEASGLNLLNTKLVVLSACETGVGEVESGEGVFGLRRAFQYAGSEAILMSLWKVDETETSSLMSKFYENWLNGIPKSQALRQAILELIDYRREMSGCSHPYFWGGFVLLGNPYQ